MRNVIEGPARKAWQTEGCTFWGNHSQKGILNKNGTETEAWT